MKILLTLIVFMLIGYRAYSVEVNHCSCVKTYEPNRPQITYRETLLIHRGAEFGSFTTLKTYKNESVDDIIACGKDIARRAECLKVELPEGNKSNSPPKSGTPSSGNK